jgi:hypothetical protein
MASIINATTAGLQETGDPNSQGVLDLQANGVSIVTLSSTTGAKFTGNLFDNGIEVGVHAQAAFNAANNSATTASVQAAHTTANNAATTASNAYAAANNASTTASNAYTAANVGSIFVTTGGTVSGNVSFANNVTVTQNLTIKSITETLNAIGTVTSFSTLTLTDGTVQTVTLTASTACTFTMPPATAGKSFVLLLKQAATTGGGTATFTGVKFGTSGAPTITSTAGKMDILTFIADGTNWYGSIAQGYTP